jgi:hypothetical protein
VSVIVLCFFLFNKTNLKKKLTSHVELFSLLLPFSVHVCSDVLASVNDVNKARPLRSGRAREEADGKERKSLSRVYDHLSLFLVTRLTLAKKENKQTYKHIKKRKEKRFKQIKSS